MNGVQLKTVLLADPITKPFFRGVYAADTLRTAADLTNYNSQNLFVCNTAPSTTAGRHWLLIYKSGERTVLADSWRIPFPRYPTEILSFLDTDKVETIPFKLQHSGSTTCGLYVLYFTHQLCSGLPVDRIVSKFDRDDPLFNDQFVVGWYKKNFNRVIPFCADGLVDGMKCISLDEYNFRLVNDRL